MRTVHRRLAAAAFLPLAFAATACGSDDKKSTDTAASQAAGQPSSAAASPGGSAPSAPNAASAAPSSANLAADKLPSALVGAGDLPAGWELGDADEPDTAGTADKPECQAVVDLMYGGGKSVTATKTAGAGIKHAGETDAMHQIALYAYDGDDATKLVSAFRKALPGCTTFAEADSEGDSSAYTYTVGEAPKLGDEAFSAVIVVKSSTVQVRVPFTFVRSGNVIAMFQVADIAGSGEAFPSDVIKAQVDKIVAAQKG